MKKIYISTAIILSTFFNINAQNIGIKLPTSTLPNTTLDVNGAVSYREGTPLSIVNGTNNNVTVDSMSFYRITAPTAIFTITGFTNGQNGRLLFLINATSYTMTLSHQTGSAAANQINTGEGTNLRIASNGSVTLIYNSTLQKWVVWSKSGEQTDWRLLGNSGTTAGTHFIGTTDAQDFVLKSNNIERARLTNSNGGGFDVAQHLAVGADAGAMTVYQTAHIAENYSGIPIETSRGLWVEQVRTEATPTAGSIMAGIEANTTYRMSGNASNGIGTGVKGTIDVDGNYGFNSLIGGDFLASTSANSGSGTQRSMIGTYGIAFNEGTGTIQEATGTYGDVTLSSTGTVTEGAGARGWAFLNGTGNFTTAYGFQGGAAKDDGATGTITTGFGGEFTSHNALTNYGLRATAYASLGGTYTNTYGGYFQAYLGHAASVFTNAYGVYSSVYKNSGTITNGFAGYFNAQHGSTTNYGVYSTVGASATNNYAFYGNVSSGSNTDWGLYLTGEDKNYFSGLVGIGTTNPQAALHVSSNLPGYYNDIFLSGYHNADIPVFNMRRARGTESAPSNLVNSDGIGGHHYYGYVNGGWNYLSGIGAYYKGNGTTTLSNLSFMTSNAERMVIDEEGRIGIGSLSSDRVTILSENTDDNFDDMSIVTYTASTTPAYTYYKARGTASSPTALGNNEYAGGFNGHVYSSSGFINATGINTITASDFTTSQGSDLSFSTGRSGTVTERMRITSTGALCIGNTNPLTHKIHVTGTAGLSTGTSWANTSDFRVKENITPYQRGLKEILAINPVFYTYKSNSGLGNGEKNIGVIAQDVEKILPEAIMTAPITLKDSTVIQDGKHLYRADAIWFAMINAFKEQQEMLDKKDVEIKQLKAKQEQTQQELEVLKKQMAQFSAQLEAMAKKQN